MSDPISLACELAAHGLPARVRELEDVGAGGVTPLAHAREDDVAAVVFGRRRPDGSLALEIVTVEHHDGVWRLLGEAQDEWEDLDASRPLRWLGLLAGERDRGTATAVWGRAGEPVATVRVEGATTATQVDPASRVFVVVTRSDDARHADDPLVLVGEDAAGTEIARDHVQR